MNRKFTRVLTKNMLSLSRFKNTAEFEEDGKKAVTITVPVGSEWRFEVAFKSILVLKVVSGIAEIFGKELPNNVDIMLSGTKAAVYCPPGPGSELTVLSYYITVNSNNMTNEPDDFIEYTSCESVMPIYTNLHLLLEARRLQCRAYNERYPENTRIGPRVLILGLRTAGKSSLAKILVSYANKMESCPILVNLEPRDGVFAIPGSITATPISDSLQVDCAGGYGFSTTSGSLLHNPKQPIVKNIGFSSFADNLDLYNDQVSRLGVSVLSRFHEDPVVKTAGAIIDTPCLAIKDLKIIENIVADFEVDTIVVLGNERLLIELKKKYLLKVAARHLDIVKVPVSGGVVELDDQFIRRSQEECIREYFYGNYKTRLSPFKTDVDIKDIVVFRGVLSLEAASRMAFLPSGDSYTAEEKPETDAETSHLELEKFYTPLTDPSSTNLDNLIIAITHLLQSNMRGKDLLGASVMGYIHVIGVDDTKGKVKVLLPYPCAVPRNVMISTSINYLD